MLAPMGLCPGVKPQHIHALAPWGQQQQGNPPSPGHTGTPRPRQGPPHSPSAPAPAPSVPPASGGTLNIAADLLTSLPGRRRAGFPPTSFTFGFQAF